MNDFKVKDISQADFGRKEISNAKVGLNVNKINTSKLSSGTYFVEITNEKFEDILLKKILIY